MNHRDPRQVARVTATESFEEEATGIADEATRIADRRYSNGYASQDKHLHVDPR